jgi:hypothetical protein
MSPLAMAHAWQHCSMHTRHGPWQHCSMHTRHGPWQHCSMHTRHGPWQHCSKHTRHGPWQHCSMHTRHGPWQHCSMHTRHGPWQHCSMHTRHGPWQHCSMHTRHLYGFPVCPTDCLPLPLALSPAWMHPQVSVAVRVRPLFEQEKASLEDHDVCVSRSCDGDVSTCPVRHARFVRKVCSVLCERELVSSSRSLTAPTPPHAPLPLVL